MNASLDVDKTSSGKANQRHTGGRVARMERQLPTEIALQKERCEVGTYIRIHEDNLLLQDSEKY